MAVSLPWKKGNKNNLGQGQISLSREAQYLAKRSRAQEGQEDTPQKSGILKNSPPGWSSDRPRVEISGEKSKYILAIKHNKNSTQNSDFALFFVSEASYSVSQQPSIWRIFLTKTFQFSFHKEMPEISKLGKLCSWTPSNHYLSWSFIHSWIRIQNNFKVRRKWRKKFQFFLQVKSWKWPGQKGVWAVVFESPVACCWFNRVQWKPFRASLTAALASCVKSDYGKTIFTERNTNNNTDHDLKISQAKYSLEHLIKVSN